MPFWESTLVTNAICPITIPQCLSWRDFACSLGDHGRGGASTVMLQGRADRPVDDTGGGVGRAGASTPYSTTGYLMDGRTEPDDKGEKLLPQSIQHTVTICMIAV